MRYVVIFAALLFSALMIVFDDAAMLGAAEGLKLFACGVFPSLFPFFVCSRCLIQSGIAYSTIEKNGGRLGNMMFVTGCAVIAAICGTPTGALLVENMQKEGRISKTSAAILCAAFNQMGPLFIFGTVAGVMLKIPSLGLLLATAHYAPAIVFSAIYALFMPAGEHKTINCSTVKRSVDSPISILASSISDAVLIILRVGGTIVFFRVVCSVIIAAGVGESLSLVIRNALFGLLEMTNSLQMLTLQKFDLRLCCSLCSAIMAFGGVCVYVQSKLLTDVKSMGYFAAKALLATLSFGLCYILYPLFNQTAPVFSDMGETIKNSVEWQGRGVAIISVLICVALSITVSSLYATFIARRTR